MGDLRGEMVVVHATFEVATSVEADIEMPADGYTDRDLIDAAQTQLNLPLDAEITDVLWSEIR